MCVIFPTTITFVPNLPILESVSLGHVRILDPGRRFLSSAAAVIGCNEGLCSQRHRNCRELVETDSRLIGLPCRRVDGCISLPVVSIRGRPPRKSKYSDFRRSQQGQGCTAVQRRVPGSRVNPEYTRIYRPNRTTSRYGNIGRGRGRNLGKGNPSGRSTYKNRD